MLFRKSTIWLFFITFICVGQIFASHIVGGDFSYRHISGDTYELKLKMYRDCSSQSQFDQTLSIGIFDKATNQRIKLISLPRNIIYPIKYNTSCINPQLRCVETGIFKGQFTMPASQFNNTAGYYVAWERCCRNNIIKNIVNPGNTPMAFYMELPSPYPGGGGLQVNNSPEFTRDPLSYLCINEPFKYDFKAIDVDGDSLHFSIITPLAGGNTSGGGGGNPGPVSVPGPYDDIIWQNTYGPSNGKYMNGAPDLAIESSKSVIYIVPKQIGVYVISILCEEFRDGVKIGEVRRELQLEVIVCPPRFKPVISTSLTNNTMLFTVGQQSCFDLNGIDGNNTEILKYRVDTAGAYKLLSKGAFFNPADASGMSTLTTKFCWTPICPLDTTDGTFIDFILYDNSCPFSQDDTVRVNFQFQSVANAVPKIKTSLANNVLNAKIDEQNCFQILGIDSNAADQIIMSAKFLNTDLFAQGATFPSIVMGQKNISAEFCWTPDCTTKLDSNTYLEIVITDNSCPKEGTDTLLVKINLLPLANEAPVLQASSLAGSKIDPEGNVTATINQEVCIAIIGSDFDIDDQIDVYLQNVNYDFLANGAKFRLIDQVQGEKQYEFCWTPNCDNMYMAGSPSVDFLIRDNKCQNEKFDTLRIYVNYELPKNNIPAIIKPDSAIYHLNAGYAQTITITGKDFDLEDDIILSAEPLFAAGQAITTDFNTVSGKDSVSSLFTIYPDCGITGDQDYPVRFKLLSNKFCNEYDTIYKTVIFKVNPLEPIDRPYIPNAFSPNNDNINDVFKIYFADRTVCPAAFKIQIFDRWGKILFESDDPSFQWKAEGMSLGAYVYVIKIGDVNFSGFVALVK
jgi:gliding motility-associated-like protein